MARTVHPPHAPAGAAWEGDLAAVKRLLDKGLGAQELKALDLHGNTVRHARAPLRDGLVPSP